MNRHARFSEQLFQLLGAVRQTDPVTCLPCAQLQWKRELSAIKLLATFAIRRLRTPAHSQLASADPRALLALATSLDDNRPIIGSRRRANHANYVVSAFHADVVADVDATAAVRRLDETEQTLRRLKIRHDPNATQLPS